MDGILSVMMRNAGQGVGVPQVQSFWHVPSAPSLSADALILSSSGYGHRCERGNPTSV